MNQDELNILAGKVYRLLLRRTTSPQEGMHVLAAVAYVIYRNAPSGYPLIEFCSQFNKAITELHAMNDIKGNA